MCTASHREPTPGPGEEEAKAALESKQYVPLQGENNEVEVVEAVVEVVRILAMHVGLEF